MTLNIPLFVIDCVVVRVWPFKSNVMFLSSGTVPDSCTPSSFNNTIVPSDSIASTAASNVLKIFDPTFKKPFLSTR